MSKKITIGLSQEAYDSLKSQIEKKESKLKEITKKKFQIKNRWTGDVIYESEKTPYKDALEEAVNKGVDLRGANLREVDLKGVDLEGVNLREVDLKGVDLEGVDLKGVDLGGANLEGADLAGADLAGANLRGANLAGADFYHAKFHGKGGTTKIKKSQVNDFLTALGVVVE